MNSPFHIFHSSDLYEIFVSGTLVTRIFKFSTKGQKSELKFEELPKPVVDDLLDQILNEK